jgi:hypothetical protein
MRSWRNSRSCCDVAVIPREGGVSSTLRLFGSAINVSGILDHPLSRVMTTEYAPAFSRLNEPEVCLNLVPPGREQGMPGACCTRDLVCKYCRKCAHEHTGTAGALRHPLRNGLTAYAALSLETNSSCLHRCRLDGSIDPVGSNSPPAAWHQPRVSGPHGFAVRFSAGHLARRAHSRENPPCKHASHLTLPRPPHPVPRS